MATYSRVSDALHRSPWFELPPGWSIEKLKSRLDCYEPTIDLEDEDEE